MPEPEFINASDAYRIYTARGGGMSYPTFLKLIQVNKLGIQPTGAHGTYMIDKVRLERWLTDKWKEVKNVS